MGLRHLSITDFRVIESLEWNVTSPLCCLFGPGDSGKSTILDAIRLALLPSWSFEFSDSDFWDCDTKYPIKIEATLGGIPEELKTERTFGLHLRGWSMKDGVVDEPSNDHEAVITVRLTVDSFFEPIWRVVTERNPDGVPISASQRATIGAFVQSPFTVDSFSWGKGTLMSKLTSSDPKKLSEIFAQAKKVVKESVDPESLESLNETSQSLKEIAEDYGVFSELDFVARVDMRNIRINKGAISLHEGEVPVRNMGVGTQKLLSLAIFNKAFSEAGTIAIDEVETGLEPHRIRQLLARLKKKEDGQIILTTHSPTVLKELDWKQLFVVREFEGTVTVKQIEKDMRSVIRAVPEAFLAKRVLFCEGKTEIGLLRACDEYWTSQGLPSLWSLGIELVDGGGDTMLKRATAFLNLGYDACCFMDSDKLSELQSNMSKFQRKGGKIIHWADTVSTDQVVIDAAPQIKMEQIWDIVIQEKDLNAVRSALQNDEESDFNCSGDISEWCSCNDFEELKATTGKIAKKKGWFKRVDLAEKLSTIILPHVNDGDLHTKLTCLKEWIHGA